MLYTEDNVRSGVQQRDGRTVFPLARGDRLTPAARDRLRSDGVAIEDAAEERKIYTTLNGGQLTEKPEDMTHLYGAVLVPKTHPRIAFRGMIDTLEAEILLCQFAVRDNAALVAALQEMLEFTRSLIRADVLGEPVKPPRLCGLSDDELREHSHHPKQYYGQPHFLPSVSDGAALLHLNRLRTVVRQTELSCCHAFSERSGKVSRSDIVLALNRLSSLCWILMIRCKSGKL